MFETPMEPGSVQSANEVHVALKSALQSMAEAEQCAVTCFGEIMERKLYRELGFSSMKHYAEQELEFSPSRLGHFMRLCEALKKLPLMNEKIKSGELGYTAARVLLPVVDETNESEWLDFALANPRRKLEHEVKRARKEAIDTAKGQQPLLPVEKKRPAAVVPVRVGLEMTPTQFARYEGLWEQIRKQGSAPTDKVEAMLQIMASFVADEKNPRGLISTTGATKPPVQIHIHKCEECAKPTVQSSKGELELGAAELEQAECDCQISRPGQRNTTSIPPKTRREILAKYRHKCQRPGCGHTRFLEAHHKVPRSEGGTNDPKNLTCLCSACHKLLHDKKLSKTGSWVKSPEAVYKWGSAAICVAPGVLSTRRLG